MLDQSNKKIIKRGIKIALYGAWLIAIVTFFGLFFHFPLLTAALGPTAYVFAAHPKSETAKIRNAIIGHSSATVVGISTLIIFRAIDTSGSLQSLYSSWYQLATVVGALFITLFLLEVFNSHHAPAAGTVVLISAGLVASEEKIIGLILGLASIILVAALMNYFFPHYKGSHKHGDSLSKNNNAS